MESRDLGTDFTLVLNEMRRSFDSLRSLRMTSAVLTLALQTTIYSFVKEPEWGMGHRLVREVVGMGAYFITFRSVKKSHALSSCNINV